MRILPALIVCVLLLERAAPHAKCSQADRHKTASQVVDEVIERMLKSDEGEVDGVKTMRWTPINPSDRARIAIAGKDAIPELSAKLDSTRPFVQLMAVQLLECIGGREIIPLLDRALGGERWVVVRTQALTVLTTVPEHEALLRLRLAAKDKDPRVRERAQSVLRDFYHTT